MIVYGTGDDQWEKEERRNRETFQNSTFEDKNDESDAVSSDQSERELGGTTLSKILYILYG